jgi:ligand-binding sensor domain-containing protein
VHAITDLNDSTLIVGTHQNGLYKLNTKNYNFKSIPYKSNYPSSSLQINAIVKNSNGIYLVGTNHGLMSFDPYKGIFALAKFDLENKYESINSSIESILIDKNKSIWLGTTNKGVIKLSLKNEIYNIEIL